jgi:Tfp pilus assembly protein PilN
VIRTPLQLDFIAPRRRRRLIGVLVLASGLVLAGAMVLKYHDAQQRLRQLEAVEGLLSTQRPARAQEGVERRSRLDGEMKSAQATARQLGLPWAQLIDSLERASLKEVAVLNIQPDAQSRLLRVTGETRAEELMLEYLRRLGSSGSFADVHLVSHQVREDDPRRPIQFSVQASFRTAP